MFTIELKMAWRNIWRNTRRTVLTACAICFASVLLIFMLSLQFGSYATMINASVKIHTGHLQIQAAGYHEKKRMRMVVPDPEAVGSVLASIAAVDVWTYRANAFSMVSTAERTYGALVIGIAPQREARVSTLKQTIQNGRYFPAEDRSAPSELTPALVGCLLAENLGIAVGDELTIMGQGRDGSVAATVARVIGIYKSGMDEYDRSTVQIPLTAFQSIYTMGTAVHEVVVIGSSLKKVPEIKAAAAARLKDRFPDVDLTVLNWETLVPGLKQAISLDLVMGVIMYFILVVVVAFSILNTFLMALFERTHEFGVLMAVGTQRSRLTRVLVAESAMLTFLGSMAGVVIGILVTLYFQTRGIDVSGSSEILSQYGISGKIHPRLSFFTVIAGPSIVYLITILSALYPALKIRRMTPLEALAHV